MKPTKAIVIIGAGNLAVQLATAFLNTKQVTVHVYNRRATHALRALRQQGAFTCTTIDLLPAEAMAYFICVSDSAIASMARQIGQHIQHGILCHCSGTTPLSVLKNPRLPYGVLYPLQTFSKNRNVNWKTIPVLLEGNTKATQQGLKGIAGLLSNELHTANSEKRLQFHLAAVLVNNFVNALYLGASGVLSKKEFALLKPLAFETIYKAFETGPEAAQTGPAKRGDLLTLKRHQQVLAQNKPLLKVYKELSSYIAKHFSNATAI